jgi:hypothetical protein
VPAAAILRRGGHLRYFSNMYMNLPPFSFNSPAALDSRARDSFTPALISGEFSPVSRSKPIIVLILGHSPVERLGVSTPRRFLCRAASVKIKRRARRRDCRHERDCAAYYKYELFYIGQTLRTGVYPGAAF